MLYKLSIQSRLPYAKGISIHPETFQISHCLHHGAPSENSNVVLENTPHPPTEINNHGIKYAFICVGRKAGNRQVLRSPSAAQTWMNSPSNQVRLGTHSAHLGTRTAAQVQGVGHLDATKCKKSENTGTE